MTKLAMITGAAGGLGEKLSRRLSGAGWSLALVSREEERLAKLSDLPNALPIVADVSTAEGAEQALGVSLAHYGQAPNALAHCAGSSLITPLHRTRPEQYRDCMRANLDSAFFALSAFVKSCLGAKQPGSAVLVGSVVGRVGVVNHEAVAAAKAGVEALIRSAAATYGSQGIRVNGILPGLMRTPMTERLFSAPQAEPQIAAQYPIGRYGTAEDGASAIAWLLSDEASWINGQALAVDGGFTGVRPMVRK